MATYRIGIGSFNLKDGAVGIGTETTGLGNLKVEGTYKVTDLDVTGVSTFTRYAGFTPDNLEIGKDSRDRTLTGEHFTTGDIVVGVNSTFTVSVGATVDVGTVPSVSIGTHFSPPKGGIEDRPEAIHEGMVQFNEDLNTLEFYNGVEWRQFTVNGASGRGVFGGGQTPTNVQIIDYVSIVTGGKAVDFGLMVSGVRHSTGAASNKVRGLYAGDGPGGTNVIEYITIASEGNSIDFGDLTANRRNPSGLASSTRGIFSCGSSVNTIDYVEIMTLGNALDFGDCLEASHYLASCASPTRGIIGGSRDATSAMISFITIASKGDSTRFGDVYVRRRGFAGSSNSVRGIFAGGSSETGKLKTTEFVTIASEGNAQYFGDLAVGVASVNSVASEIRSVIAGGTLDSGKSDRIESVTIATAGNAVDFGDLTLARGHSAGLSDSHGGLGGY